MNNYLAAHFAGWLIVNCLPLEVQSISVDWTEWG